VEDRGRSDEVRPEWLFEVATRVQSLAMNTDESARLSSGEDLFASFPPGSVLERQIRHMLLERLQARGPRCKVPPATGRCPEGMLHPEGPHPHGLGPEVAVRQAILLIDANPTSAWTVERLARRVGCNRTDLECGFRRLTSHTIHQYLSARRVTVAQTLLRTTAWRVEAVARSVGYRSKVSLYQHFGRTLGMTPDEYRQRWAPRSPSSSLVDWIQSGPPPTDELPNMNRRCEI
jgi:AraC-like DNA-binding protein